MNIHKGISVFENLSDIRKYLSGVNYPARKEQIFHTVQKLGANMNVMTMFQILPDDREFHTPREVLGEMGLTLSR